MGQEYKDLAFVAQLRFNYIVLFWMFSFLITVHDVFQKNSQLDEDGHRPLSGILCQESQLVIDTRFPLWPQRKITSLTSGPPCLAQNTTTISFSFQVSLLMLQFSAMISRQLSTLQALSPAHHYCLALCWQVKDMRDSAAWAWVRPRLKWRVCCQQYRRQDGQKHLAYSAASI